MSTLSKKMQILARIRANPGLSQQALAEALGLSRSAVAGHIAALQREGQILGRAYILPQLGRWVCLGGANWDRKLRLQGPMRMQTSNPVGQSDTPGGVARNFAAYLAQQGRPVHLLSAFGDDPAAQALVAHTQAQGIDISASLQVPGVPCSTYTAILDAAGGMQVAFAQMQACSALDVPFMRQTETLWRAADWVMADLNLTSEALRYLCSTRAGPMLWVAVSEAKMAHLPAQLDGLEWLVLNRGELAALGEAVDSPAAQQAALSRLHARGVRGVALTLGEAGVCISHAESGCLRLPAPAVRTCDATGAGDAFAAGFALALQLAPHEVAAAAQAGIQAAAAVLQHAGSSVFASDFE